MGFRRDVIMRVKTTKQTGCREGLEIERETTMGGGDGKLRT